MILERALARRRSWNVVLFVLLVLVACSGGDLRDTPMRAVQAVASWATESAFVVEHRSPARYDATFPQWDTRGDGFGGWMLDARHAWDPVGQRVLRGDGTTFHASVVERPLWAVREAGWEVPRDGWGTYGEAAADGANALGVGQFFDPVGVAIDARGTVFLVLEDARIFRIDSEGKLRLVANLGATATTPTGLAIGPNGEFYVSVQQHRVWRVEPDGTYALFAGTGTAGAAGVVPTPGPATTVDLNDPRDVAVASDGTVFIAEKAGNRIRRVGTDGIMTTFAGGGNPLGYECTGAGGLSDSVDDVDATSTQLCYPTGLDVASDGTVYFTQPNAVYRVTSDGRLHRVAGVQHTIASCPAGSVPPEGSLALQACLPNPQDVAVIPGGGLVVTSEGVRSLYEVSPYGLIKRFGGRIGGEGAGHTTPRTRALEGWARWPQRMAIDPRGFVHAVSYDTRAVWRIEPDVPDNTQQSETRIVSPDGAEAYFFNGDGLHVRTEDATTGRTRLTFSYVGGRLSAVADAYGNTTQFAYTDTATTHTFTVTGPDGATVTGTLTDGWLSALDAGIWGTHHLVYTGTEGLLTAMQDAAGRWHRFDHDTQGRLTRDAWGASASADASPARVVSFPGASLTPTTAGATRSVTVREGASTSAGLDTTHARQESRDGTEERTNTPPIGPPVTTRQWVTGDQGVWTWLWGLRPQTTTWTRTTGANGAAWTRTGSWDDPHTPTTLDGYALTDARVGSSVSDSLWMTTLTRQEVTPTDAREWRDVTAVTETRAVLTASRAVTEPTTFVYDTFAPQSVGTSPLRWTTTRTRATTTSGWTVTTRSPRDRVTTTVLDVDGRVVSVQPPSIEQDGATMVLHPVQNEYDSRGRLWRVTHGARRLTYTYAGSEVAAAYRGLVASVTAGTTSASGPTRVTGYAYGVDGDRTTRTTLPGGRELRSGVDVEGHVVALTPPGQSAHAFEYGRRGVLEAYRPPATSTLTTAASQTETAYQVTGHLAQAQRPEGVFDYSYDHGRLQTVTLPVPSGGGARPTVTYAYDDVVTGLESSTGTGALRSVTHSGNGAVEYGRDVPTRGALPLRETWRVSEGGVETTRAVSWTYDALGQVGSLTVEGGPTLPLTYDADGLATNVGGLVIARDRLAGTEQGTTLTAGSGTVTTTQRYDEYGQVYARGSSYGAASGTGLSFAYEYDEFGRLRRVTESGEGADEARWYAYDSAGRLARVCATDTCLDAMGATTEREAYAYDANGHRTGWTNGAETGTSTTVDAQDRLLSQTTSAGTTTFAYDAAGRLQTRTGPSGTSTLGWDAFGALTTWTQTSGGVPISSVEYRQDALGRRIARVVSGTVTARWVYSGIHPVGEYDASWGLKRVFVYATRTHVPDVVLANASGTWVPYRVVTDHLGSVRRVVRVSDGEVVQRMRYDSYGRVLQDEAASGWERVPFGYAGGLYDRVTGLVRFGAREYDASLGRWLSKDPIGFDGGDSNVYAYVGNTPSMHVDPNGLSWDINDLASVIPGVNLFAAGARERAQGIFEMGNEATVDRGACRMQRGAAMMGLGAGAAGMFAMMVVGVASLAAPAVTNTRTVVFYHGTSRTGANAIRTGGLRSVSVNTHAHPPGSFFTHLDGHVNSRAGGTFWAVSRGGGEPVVLRGEMDAMLFKNLESRGLVVTGPTPGARGNFPPETVFYPEAFTEMNSAVSWSEVPLNFTYRH